MTDRATRPPIGTRIQLAWADGTRSGVTIVPTGKAVPANQVNVMRDEDGSIVTVNIGQLGTTPSDGAREPLIRRRSLPDSLRYLAEKLNEPLSDAERVGVALTLNSIADEIDPPRVPCTCTDTVRSRIDYCPMPHEREYGICPKQRSAGSANYEETSP